MFWLLLIVFPISIFSSKEMDHFRSILIKRACEKRPELFFCDDVVDKTRVKSTSNGDHSHVIFTNADGRSHANSTNTENMAHVKPTSSEERAHVKATSIGHMNHVKSTSSEDRTHIKSASANHRAHVESTNSDENFHVKSSESEKVRVNSEGLTPKTQEGLESPSTMPHVQEKMSKGIEDEEISSRGQNINSRDHERRGSLLRLPKPPKIPEGEEISRIVDSVSVSKTTGSSKTTPVPESSATTAFNTTAASTSINTEELGKNETSITESSEEKASNSSFVDSAAVQETQGGVLVFISEYCVVERERFVRKCNGEVDKKEVEFCKSYPSACAATKGVVPVLSYCQRYFMEYPRLCRGNNANEKNNQFCFAFEQFCLPELTAAHPQTTVKPKANLKRCSDVVDEARKACHPFPLPSDTFNQLRCRQFLKNCGTYVDWE